MTNNKAREVNNPIIKQLLDETSPEELAKIDTEMTNNEQQTAVEWLRQEVLKQDIDSSSRELYKQAKEMEIAGKEISYADGYSEGYKRAMELVEFAIEQIKTTQ